MVYRVCRGRRSREKVVAILGLAGQGRGGDGQAGEGRAGRGERGWWRSRERSRGSEVTYRRNKCARVMLMANMVEEIRGNGEEEGGREDRLFLRGRRGCK